MPDTVPGIYRAIAAVAAEISKIGIAKDRQNDQQHYSFRGIDDVYNALAPILATHGLCILPRVLERAVVERQTRNGGALFYVTVHVAFDFVCAEDGSRHEVITYGEAMDSGDKATNKAMSAAYKYAAMQAFCIPTAGDNDADSTSHGDVKPARAARAPRRTEERPERDERPAAATPADSARITEGQRKNLEGIAKANGHTHDGLKAWLAQEHGIESTTQIPPSLFATVARRLSDKTPLTSRAA